MTIGCYFVVSLEILSDTYVSYDAYMFVTDLRNIGSMY